MAVVQGQATTPYAQAIRTPFAAIAAELQRVLGQRLVAYAVGISTKNVGRWANGTGPRQQTVETRVRDLYRIVLSLQPALSDEGIRAWLMSANPELQDAAPIERLRSDDTPTSVLAAAESFRALIA